MGNLCDIICLEVDLLSLMHIIHDPITHSFRENQVLDVNFYQSWDADMAAEGTPISQH